MSTPFRKSYIDTARPLPFQMRHARWLEGEESSAASGPPEEESSAASGPPEGGPKTYDEAYVRRLKNENQSLRNRLRDAEARLAEAKTPEDIEAAVKEFKDKNGELERNLLAVTVAADKRLPKGYAERLRGTTQQELEADADWYLANGVVVEEDEDGIPPRGGLRPQKRKGAAVEADALIARVDAGRVGF